MLYNFPLKRDISDISINNSFGNIIEHFSNAGKVNTRDASKAFLFSDADEFRIPFIEIDMDGVIRVSPQSISSAMSELNSATDIDEETKASKRKELEQQIARFGNDVVAYNGHLGINASPRSPKTIRVNGSEETISMDTLRLMTLDSIHTIEFEATVYNNDPSKNSNRAVIAPNEFPGFAKTLDNRPFLADHSHHQLGERLGTIVSSFSNGEDLINRIRITTQKGIRMFKEGIIDRFSTAWVTKFDNITCSDCGRNPFICGHLWEPASNAYMIHSQSEGIETSAVNVPAVSGTHIHSFITEDKKGQMGNQQDVESQQNADVELDIDTLADNLQLPQMMERIAHLEATIAEMSTQMAQMAQIVNQETGANAHSQQINLSKKWSGYQQPNTSSNQVPPIGLRGVSMNESGESKKIQGRGSAAQSLWNRGAK